MGNLLIVGDVHTDLKGLYDLVCDTVKTEKIDAVLQVGDFELYQSDTAMEQEQKYLVKLKKERASRRLKNSLLAGTAPKFPVPVFYIKGNHEDFDNLGSKYLKRINIHYIPQGYIMEIGGRVVAGIGGIHSSSKKYRTTEALEGYDRRFYTKEDIGHLLKNPLSNDVEILITHQAAADVIPEKTPGKRRTWEEGTKDFEELLKMPKLRHYIHGHHHINYVVNGGQIADKNLPEIRGLGNFSKNKESFCII